MITALCFGQVLTPDPDQAEKPMRVSPTIAAVLLASCFYLSPAAAQTVPPLDIAPGQAESPAAAQPGGSSLSHSALKAITYKIGTTAANITILSAAAGSLLAGTALTALVTTASLVVYAVNDHLWESYVPPPVKQDDIHQFDMTDEFWRTSEKFMTYKATTIWIKAVKLASVYGYTGSTTTTLAAITASTVVNAGIFYANNFAWDYYDWCMTPTLPPAAPPLVAASPPEAAPKS
jgi:uncharacterized membrane protein